jgi:hypothetical protein
MTEAQATAPAIALADDVGAVRPYAPSWIHPLTDAIDRLPGPRWIAFAGIAIVGSLLQHAQLWSTGRVEVGTPDRVQVYWGLVIAGGLWLPGYLERSARASFERFRPALQLSSGEADRLGYELTIIPGRMSALITLLSAAVTIGAFVGDPEGSSVAGLPPAMLALAFVIQTVMAAVILQVLYRLIRQVRLVREILDQHVEVNVFRPGPLHAIAALTARPGAVLTLLLATVVVVVPFSTDPVAFLIAWAPLLIVPPLVAIAAFVAPLTGAHARLEAQKEQLVGELAGRLSGLVAEINRDADAGRLDRADGLNKMLGSLLQERDVLARLPTWPWSIGTLRSFLSAIFLPLTLFVIQQLISRAL